MPRPDWDDRYLSGDTPWDSGQPNDHLVEFARSLPGARKRAIDVGCGTGTNALWLARQGFAVLGVDISSIAIDKARAKAADAGLDCRFQTLDFLHDEIDSGPFDFVFDLGCLHVFDDAGDRERFAERVASLLGVDGRWLNLSGSTEGPEREYGPPRRSTRDLVGAIEPALEIVELRSIELQATLPVPVAAWLCVSRPRREPAQLSTQRDQAERIVG